MRQWRRALGNLSSEVERRIDRARLGIRRRAGRRPPFMLVGYPGFGTPERLVFVGRALENRGVRSPRDTDSRLRNLINIYRSMHAGELPGARVQVEFAGATLQLTTDGAGFFEVWLTPERPLDEAVRWHEATLTLLDPYSRRQGPVSAAVPLSVASPSAEYGVISDLDDTVIRTDATNLLRMARNVLFANARTRLPFPGVASFYRALEGGASGTAENPIFYVSSGPWNLYDLIAEFLHVQNIPAGPITLRRWGLSRGSSLPTRHTAFKLEAIRRILELEHRLPFILIGDSGQEDPEVYRKVAHAFPGRILAVYIRNVSRHPERSERIRELAAEVLEAEVPLVLADDTLELAEHASAHGWITAAALPAVRGESEADEAAAAEPAVPTVIVEEGIAVPEWANAAGRKT